MQSPDPSLGQPGDPVSILNAVTVNETGHFLLGLCGCCPLEEPSWIHFIDEETEAQLFALEPYQDTGSPKLGQI